jgi:serine/threonine protein kinase
MPLPSNIMAATGETVAQSPQKQQERPRSSLQERFGKMLQVSTKIMDTAISGNTPKGDAKTPTGRQSSSSTRASLADPRTIVQITNFDESYTLGKEVMPSTHSYMKVHFATRKSDGAEVVVKLRFKPKCFRSKEDERNWRRSTEYLLNMPDSSHICRLYEVLEDPKTFYIVMEKVSGMDLFETLESAKVPVEVGREILRQLLAAMAHLHAHNAVHKDLKLENIMIDATPKYRDGYSSGPSPTSVKVIDFDTLDQWTPASGVAKDVVGTDQYIAQEAYAGKYSPLSDVFAVGVIAYKLLTGRFPFHDEIFDDEAGENWVGSPKMLQIRRRLKVAKIEYSHSVFREQPQALDLVMRMLSYNEQNRPTAAAALEHDWLREDFGSLISNGSSSPDAEVKRRASAARNEYEDLFDDGIIVAEEAIVGETHRQALLRK